MGSNMQRQAVPLVQPEKCIVETGLEGQAFHGRIHFEFDKCIACEVCVRVCPINLPIVDWKVGIDIGKKRLENYSIDFGICIFCGNCVEYCPTNCLAMTEEYELSTYDRHKLNYDHIALRTFTNIAVAQILIYIRAVNILILFAVTQKSDQMLERDLTNNIQRIGVHLSTDFFLPFELISIILLVTLIGTITIARREETV
ncbi:NAD(P)H-quinone oxidoreductase subunit I, chloroplastic-like [Cryptomeria japonica]|uniref:NAD(P)H-quinone oxidoreductase subunit I, chloroplastic-like n=1 Tax=Cryptomeria japonica TaxID=3369 RepID=UPI0027DAAAE4|nr:NAD(P)H-quinone oxidoreductase subunit I, chloroplastic-like [Cryptomeria japonica]